jgi:chemotaxis protein CheD
MNKPAQIIDIFLGQGEVYFGDSNTRIRTVLGSCVAITMWHPQRRLGGMCHYMLPTRRARSEHALDGRYADEALALMLQEIRHSQTRAEDYQVKLFGGGAMLQASSAFSQSGQRLIGDDNVQAGRDLLQRHGLRIEAEHLGGLGHHSLLFEIWSGDVWVRQAPLLTAANDEGKAA